MCKVFLILKITTIIQNNLGKIIAQGGMKL